MIWPECKYCGSDHVSICEMYQYAYGATIGGFCRHCQAVTKAGYLSTTAGKAYLTE